MDVLADKKRRIDIAPLNGKNPAGVHNTSSPGNPMICNGIVKPGFRRRQCSFAAARQRNLGLCSKYRHIRIRGQHRPKRRFQRAEPRLIILPVLHGVFENGLADLF
jgi:hypothetical protein